LKAYSLMVFYLCVNMAAYIINQSGAFIESQLLYINPFDVSNQFSLTVFGGLLIGGGIIGVIALITRQYVYASVALVVWVIGLILPVAQWFLLGTPIVLNALIPVGTDGKPVLLPVEINDVWVSGFTLIIVAFFAFIFFMFMIEIASQRQIT